MDEGARKMTARGMDYHFGRLVNHEKMFVFEGNIEGDVFGFEKQRLFLRNSNDDFFAAV